jgi:acetylornithine deacetylase/succinyl-diaminopimelate desuccinylase-like protein
MKHLWIYVLVAAVGISRCASAQNQVPDVASLVDMFESYRSTRQRDIVRDFSELLSLPNVATNLSDMERNAERISDLLEARGFAVELLEGGGAPYIYAELTSEPAKKTLLLYAHYDGQPVLPEDWTYPPFTPTLLDAPLEAGGRPVSLTDVSGSLDPEWRLYARSAGDDKMPIIAMLHALDALEQYGIPLAVNLKLFLDGEEEQGSPTLAGVLDQHRALLDADLMLFCDGPMHQSRRPQLVFGSRGDMVVDLTAYGPLRPLHSGHYGNWAPNPIMRLARLLTSMRDESGRILIKGYYDDVVPLAEEEREAIDNMPDMTTALQEELAIRTPEGDGARLEELIARPALNARGIAAGGVGEFGSNIIRPSATVSLDLRLVPDQMPRRIRELIENHIVAQGYYVVHEEPSAEVLRAHDKVMKVDWRGGAVPAMRTSLEHAAVRDLISLMQQAAPGLLLTPTFGGTLPLHEFGVRFATPIVVLPLANHDNNQHAENENIRLQNIWDAISLYGALFARYGRD